MISDSPLICLLNAQMFYLHLVSSGGLNIAILFPRSVSLLQVVAKLRLDRLHSPAAPN